MNPFLNLYSFYDEFDFSNNPDFHITERKGLYVHHTSESGIVIPVILFGINILVCIAAILFFYNELTAYPNDLLKPADLVLPSIALFVIVCFYWLVTSIAFYDKYFKHFRYGLVEKSIGVGKFDTSWKSLNYTFDTKKDFVEKLKFLYKNGDFKISIDPRNRNSHSIIYAPSDILAYLKLAKIGGSFVND